MKKYQSDVGISLRWMYEVSPEHGRTHILQSPGGSCVMGSQRSGAPEAPAGTLLLPNQTPPKAFCPLVKYDILAG